MSQKKIKVLPRHHAQGKNIGHEHKDECCGVHSDEKNENIKNVTIMRHGRVDFSYHTSYIYLIVHSLLNRVRKFAARYSLLKENIFYRGLAKLSKNLKKELDRRIDSDVDYGSLNYEQFMRFLLCEIDPPLAKRDNKINLKKIPKEIDVIYHSSSRRSIQSAKYIQEQFIRKGKQPRIETGWEAELDEVEFSDNIITREEFNNSGGLAGCREIVLSKWFNGKNQAEVFQDSISRIEKLCDFLKNSSDRNILLITHGWYLRLLYIYFNKEEKSFENLNNKNFIFKHGQAFRVRLRQDFSPHLSFSNKKGNGFEAASLFDQKSQEPEYMLKSGTKL